MASTHPIPTARQGPAQRNRFPINKTAGSGPEDFMGSSLIPVGKGKIRGKVAG